MARMPSASAAVLAVAAALVMGACDATDPSPSASATPSPTAASPSPSPSPSPTPEPSPVPLDDLDVELRSWADGFTRPVLVASRPGDDRVYVVEQPGRIRSLRPDGTGRVTVLDIRGRVGSEGNEQGLLGMAFHPDDPGRMFLYYTDTRGNSRLVEYSFPLDAAKADPDPVQRVLRRDQPRSNHNGGMIAFGPDGMLYVGLGDGGGAGDPDDEGQDPGSWLGSLLRIDVDAPSGYAIPPDNPFADGRGGAEEVWAYGLRNPWRFSFDGDMLYIADVGQKRVEELNVVRVSESAGANFGWNTMEGNLCYPSGDRCSSAERGFVGPVYHYRNGDGGRCSITGGYVYRGEEYPELWGVYLFGDFCSGELIGLRVVDGEVVDRRVLRDTSVRISSFGVGSDGRVYVTDLSDGRVLRVALDGGGS